MDINMFNEVFLIYLITRFDKILSVTHGILVFFLFIGLGCLLGYGASFDESFGSNKEFRKNMVDGVKKLIIIPIIALIINTLVPSNEDMKFILAGTGLVEISKSDTAQRMAGKSVQIVEQYLDSLLKEEKK